MKNFFNVLIGMILLVGGYFLGSSWSAETNHAKIDTSIAADDTIAEAIKTEDTSFDLKPDEKATIALFQEAAPSVVFINTSTFEKNYFTMNIAEIPKGSGSGFLWDVNGHIVTNYHVLEGADKATVTLADQSSWNATLIGAAPDKDLAVLKIDAPASVLSPLPVGKSSNLQVGQTVLAIGNPFGLDQTLTTGIISALGREIKGAKGFPIKDAIQTDAAINPGNSGGPLLNSSGELVGVNTAIYSPSGAYAGIGFSIPVDAVRWIIPELIKYGKIKRPTLGVEIASNGILQRLGKRAGVLIVKVIPDGPAAQAGLQPTLRNRRGDIILGDIIRGVNDEVIDNSNQLSIAIEKYKTGDQIKLTLERQDELVEVMLILGQEQ
jgi:S1-C subfamily serine protease